MPNPPQGAVTSDEMMPERSNDMHRKQCQDQTHADNGDGAVTGGGAFHRITPCQRMGQATQKFGTVSFLKRCGEIVALSG